MALSTGVKHTVLPQFGRRLPSLAKALDRLHFWWERRVDFAQYDGSATSLLPQKVLPSLYEYLDTFCTITSDDPKENPAFPLPSHSVSSFRAGKWTKTEIGY